MSSPAPLPDSLRHDSGQPQLAATHALLDFTSGFGPILRQELALQAALEHHRSSVVGPRASELKRLLDHQRTLTLAGIATLEKHCEQLPHGKRFQRTDWRQAKADGADLMTSNESGDWLRKLANAHRELAVDLRTLVTHASVEPHPELDAVAGNHEEMAWVLSALASVGDPVVPAPPAGGRGAVTSWENEGGALGTKPEGVAGIAPASRQRSAP